MILVDAHEDLAWNSLTFQRDYLRPVAETRSAEAGTDVPRWNGESLIGYPEWQQGRVAVVFATLFAAPERHRLGEWDQLCYREAGEAAEIYRRQLDFYHRWADDHPEKLQLVQDRDSLDAVCAPWQAEPDSGGPVGLVLLMEGADGVREPAELEEWFDAGVRILGPAWSGTRYAGGTMEPGPFSREGKLLLEMMADLGMVLDLTHLSDEGVMEALDTYAGPLIASHSNPRALVPNHRRPERHLADEAIRRLAAREGVVGIVLANHFLRDGWQAGDGRQAVDLGHVAAHIDYVCQLVGDATHVGIGSDFDGGFGLSHVPKDFDSVADLPKIGEALRERGYQPQEVEAVLGGNWLALLQRALPQA